jgi:hypothetical protein
MLLQFNTVSPQLSSTQASEILIHLATISKNVYHFYKDIRKQTC